MNPCSAEFRSFAGYQIIDYAQPCDPRVHVLLPSLEKSVGEMTVPFRKSLVPFIFSSPPETHPTFHVFQCGAPLEMITCASHLCGDWVHIGLGTDTLAHSQGCILEREQRESIEKESPGLFWSVRFSHYSFCTPPTGLLFVPSTLFLT